MGLNRSSEFTEKVREMRLNIAPIVSLANGCPAPDFPQTLLQLFLLTEDQLDNIAHYYSQVEEDEFTNLYPQTMGWDPLFLEKSQEGEKTRQDELRLSNSGRLEIKRRKFAKFIGMRGAETPLWEVSAHVQVLEDRIRRRVEEEEMKLAKEKRC